MTVVNSVGNSNRKRSEENIIKKKRTNCEQNPKILQKSKADQKPKDKNEAHYLMVTKLDREIKSNLKIWAIPMTG